MVYVTVPRTGQTVKLYVVTDKTAWNNGDPLIDVSDGAETVTLSSGTGTQTIKIWAPPRVVGKYDIIMDVDNDGVFDAGLDLVDSVLITGFFIIPEVPLGTLTILLLTLLSLAIYKNKLKFKQF